ncbi:MAG: hypothetical protein WCV86_01135 [Patescibacteria group bacterium]|jgi:hypothetical protein
MKLKHQPFGYGEGQSGHLVTAEGICITSRDSAVLSGATGVIALEATLVIVDLSGLRVATHSIVDGMGALMDELEKRNPAPRVVWIIGTKISMLLASLELADLFEQRESCRDVPELAGLDSPGSPMKSPADIGERSGF